MTMLAGMKYETGGRLVRGDGTEYEIVAVRPDGTLHLRRLAGSGLYTGTFKREPVPAFEPAVMPPDWRPDAAAASAPPPPEARPKVLSMWPLRQVSRETLDWWSADKADLILP